MPWARVTFTIPLRDDLDLVELLRRVVICMGLLPHGYGVSTEYLRDPPEPDGIDS